jgi:hypothetical protein
MDADGWTSCRVGLLLIVLTLIASCGDHAGQQAQAALCPPGSLVYDRVIVNEILAHTDPPYEDAIELYNPSDGAVCIGGWYLTDRDGKPKFRIPDGTSLPARGYAAFYEYQFNRQPGAEASFALSEFGEAVYLLAADVSGQLTGYRDGGEFEASANGQALGRHQAADGLVFLPLTEPTFGAQDPRSLDHFRAGTGAENAPLLVGPLVITELMYDPADASTEYIELYNLSDARVSLSHPAHPTITWRFTAGIEYAFPANTTVLPGQTFLVVRGDPEAFRADHALPGDLLILGPFKGKLKGDGERVTLSRPDELDLKSGQLPYVVVDSLAYQPGAPWPAIPAGGGVAIERIDRAAPADDPGNWRLSPAGGTPGR